MVNIKWNTVRDIDCMDKNEGLPSLPDKSIDCIITSPPYWKGFEYEAYFNSYAQYLRWCKKWLKECKRILKQNGFFWLNVINDSEITTRAFEIMQIATEELLWKLHDTIIWFRYNQQPANTSRQLTNQCEYIFMLRHTSTNIDLYKENAYERHPHIFKTKNVGNVWMFPFKSSKEKDFGRKELKSKWGHSGFPIELPETCILLSTKENDIVLDMFVGSGTTIFACINLKRQYLGFDLNPDYIKRLKKLINSYNPIYYNTSLRSQININSPRNINYWFKKEEK